MAYLFELAADCGDNPQSASDFGGAFDGLSWTLSDGTSVGCAFKPSDVWRSNDKVWWCRVVPDGVSITGAGSRKVSTESLIVEVARLLYKHLRHCSGFRSARVGWEVEESLDVQDWLVARLDPSTISPGVVVGRQLFLELGSPMTLEPFGVDSFWRPLQESDYMRLVKL